MISGCSYTGGDRGGDSGGDTGRQLSCLWVLVLVLVTVLVMGVVLVVQYVLQIVEIVEVVWKLASRKVVACRPAVTYQPLHHERYISLTHPDAAIQPQSTTHKREGLHGGKQRGSEQENAG